MKIKGKNKGARKENVFTKRIPIKITSPNDFISHLILSLSIISTKYETRSITHSDSSRKRLISASYELDYVFVAVCGTNSSL